jgi:LmbE family N-acetylglucosaminyl deacetylase
VAAEVCQMVGARLLEAPVWMWHWSEPKDGRVPWNRMVSLKIPIDVTGRKGDALAAHGSQLTPRSSSVGPVLGPEILERSARDREYYFV